MIDITSLQQAPSCRESGSARHLQDSTQTRWWKP